MTKDGKKQDVDLESLTLWLNDNKSNLPAMVENALLQYLTLTSKLSQSNATLKNYLLQLRRALGITASSEKRAHSSVTKKRKTPTLAELRDRQVDHGRLEKWHKAQARKHSRKAKRIEDRMKDLEDIELTAEELAENEAEHEAYKKRLQLGDGLVEPPLENPYEALMEGISADATLVEEDVKVTKEQIASRKVLDRTTEKRSRFDVSLEVTQHELEIEKVIVKNPDGERTIISASTAAYGPSGYSVTWNFLSTISILVSQYALPLNRIAGMLSSGQKTFSSSMMSKYYCYVATRLAPIYLHLFHELARSDLLAGDDTSSRVTEVNRYYKNLDKDPEKIKPPPWIAYQDIEKAKKTLSVDEQCTEALLAAQLGFQSKHKNQKTDKRAFNTTVISGRSDPQDPRSSILFYRSHFGSYGNLLSIILKRRNPTLKKLWIQADMSTTNLLGPEEEDLGFDISYAACASHARRPFALYRDDDPDNCDYMLHLFHGIYIYEDGLDLYGRNTENVTAVRKHDSLKMYEEILELAQNMQKRWSPKTELGKACAYIIRHYDKLTAYTEQLRLSPDNNFSERALRLEKMIQSASLFRTSLKGRFALDIHRTVIQTAIMARVKPNEYLQWVLKKPDAEIKANPQMFTPLEFLKTLDE